jgi:hypothetical protein
MSRVVRTSALLAAASALVVLALVTAGGAAAGSPEAQAAGACNISGQERNLGASYVTSLRVRHTSCRTGKSVVRAYQKCRRAGGWRGKCGHSVNGFGCSRRILDSSSVQYDAKVTCRNGAKRVVHTYTQNK